MGATAGIGQSRGQTAAGGRVRRQSGDSWILLGGDGGENRAGRIEHNAPNRIDTKFNLGSINKFFTKVAIFQLVEQGKLSLDDTVGKHLPDYPNKEAATKATIKHLLDMQSGIGDFFGPKFDATPKNRIRAIKDYLPLFADQPLKFEPGTSRNYSNGGYIVLGAIIEKVTGQSYYDYVRERIFKPAGMENSARIRRSECCKAASALPAARLESTRRWRWIRVVITRSSCCRITIRRAR